MEEGNNLLGLCISVIISLCYCYYVSSTIPKGKLRFISLLPVFSFFSILPLYTSSALATLVTAFFIALLAISALPINLDQNQNKNYKQPRPKKIPQNLATHTLSLAILVTVVHDGREGNYKIHPSLVLVLYCCIASLFIDVVVGSLSMIVYALTGLELEQPSDEPYLSTSLQDFWARRWNLTVTNMLRHIVYLPVRSSSSSGLLRKDKAASLVGVFASFFVSGLIHELIFYYPTRVTPTWEAAAFFWLHGICVVVEMAAKRVVADRWQLPPYVSCPLSVGFVVITSFWLLFPPIIRNGLDVKIIDEMMFILEYVNSSAAACYDVMMLCVV